MELLLHSGLNKTGSSFLQSVLLQGQGELEQYGVYLPPCKWDDDLREGKITPGNGHEFAWYLALDKSANLRKLLSNYKEEALKRNCNKIILSNEVLIRLFSSEDILNQLDKVSRSLGFEKIRVWTVFRPFFEHSLSLFKHRSKRGDFPDYDSWFEQDYETLRLLDQFLQVYNKYDWHWFFTGYTRNTAELVKNIRAVTAIPDLEFSEPDHLSVNPSLSLDEVALIQFLESTKKGAGRNMYQEFIKVQSKRHDHNELLDKFFKAAEQYFSRYSDTMAKAEKLISTQPYSLSTKPVVRPTDNQLSCLLPAHLEVAKKEMSALANMGVKKKLELKLKAVIRKSRKAKGYDHRRYGGTLRYFN